MTRTLRTAALACLISLITSVSSYAGILASNAGAIDPAFTGTVSVTATSGSNTLDANLDFAVFTATEFNNQFGGLGYTPTGPIVYTYQLINNDPSVPLTTQIVGIANAASDIGTFDIGDVDATSAALAPDATWSFAFPPGIPVGDSSYGLAFSSSNLPEFGNSLTISLTNFGGISRFLGDVVPTPSATEIPEPASALLVVAACFVGLNRRRG